MKKYCIEWAAKQELPSDHFLIGYMVVLILTALSVAAVVKTVRTKDLHKMLLDAGVAGNKVAKTAWEIERKRFKLMGLGVPMLHQISIYSGFPSSYFLVFGWTFTISSVCVDIMRIYNVLFVGQSLDWVFKRILRKHEQHQLSNASYFVIGCAVTVQLFAPVIAMTSIIFLVMGVLSAALTTRSFGKSIFHIGAGAHGKKSLEGFAAMLLVCFVFGCTIFHGTYLREYSVFFAALTATLIEYHEPFGINYNVSIPIVTSIALTVGFERTLSCGSSIVVE